MSIFITNVLRMSKSNLVWLQAECSAGALSMLSVQSPDYVLTVLVSIFISKTHNHFWSSISTL